jgi:hypothetical protein
LDIYLNYILAGPERVGENDSMGLTEAEIEKRFVSLKKEN